MAKLTQQELERHLWQAADILRGTVDAGDYKQYIFALLFYRRLCDVWDEEFETLLAETGDREEAADPDEHRFHVPPEHRWDTLRKRSTQIGQHLNNAFAAIEDANLRLKGIFGDVDFANQERFPDAQLEKLLAHFEKHRLRNADVPADMLGDAYMYLIKQFAEGSGKKGGEFYTPRQVVRLIVACLDPQPGMSIYDPTGGSGGMLLEAVQHLKEKGQDPKSLALYGQEKNLGTWAIAQINLFLHDIDDAFIAKGDTILNPKRYDPKTREFVDGLGAYDRVMANPPFSEKVWGYEVWSNGDHYGRDKYGCPPKGYGDLAFVQHMIASLKEDGMLGVVVPHGVLFRGGAEGRIREAMLRADIIEAVIGLAPNLFYGAGIPAAILLIRKKKPQARKGSVLVVNGDATFLPGKAQNTLTDPNVATLAGAFHGFTDIDKLARVVPIPEIEGNGFNLNISRYVQTGADVEMVDVAAEVANLQDLIAKRNEAEAVMFNFLAGLQPSDTAPDDWIETNLGSVAILGGGTTPSKADAGYWDDPTIPWATPSDITSIPVGMRRISQTAQMVSKRAFKECSLPLNPPGTVLMTSRATIGYIAINDVPMTTNQGFITFKCNKLTEPDFLFHWLITNRNLLISAAGGSTFKELGRGTAKLLRILLPPIPEQRRISAVLGAIDEVVFLTGQIGRSSDEGKEGKLDRVKRTLASDLLSGRVRVPA